LLLLSRKRTLGLSERFAILAALCEEKCKILIELVDVVISDAPKPEVNRATEGPGREPPDQQHRGDN
jgi:hypothetical protein